MQSRVVAMNGDEAFDQQTDGLVKRKPLGCQPGQSRQSRLPTGKVTIKDQVEDCLLVPEILVNRSNRNARNLGYRVGVDGSPAIARQNPSSSLDNGLDGVS